MAVDEVMRPKLDTRHTLYIDNSPLAVSSACSAWPCAALLLAFFFFLLFLFEALLELCVLDLEGAGAEACCASMAESASSSTSEGRKIGGSSGAVPREATHARPHKTQECRSQGEKWDRGIRKEGSREEKAREKNGQTQQENGTNRLRETDTHTDTEEAIPERERKEMGKTTERKREA